MGGIRAVMRGGYQIAKMLPHLAWLPLEMKRQIRRATNAFEDELLQNGLDRDIARELARTFHDANKEMASQFTSPRAWMKA